MSRKSVVAVTAVVVVAVAVGAWQFVVREADRRLNRVSKEPPYEAGARALQLHERIFVADMHADFLLWRRKFAKKYERGHVDLPRLIEGNIGLQVFSVVTKSPWGQNYQQNEADTDRITPLAIAQAWPIATWGSLLERALYQSRRLHAFEAEGDVTIIRTAADLDAFLRRRESRPDLVAGLLAAEGLHPLEGRIENVDRLFDAGYRMMAPVHMFDNAVAGSAQGVERGGLTEFGRRVIRRMEDLAVVVDLAHASAATIRDVLEISTRPVVVSHTGVQGTCDSPRNLTDDQLRGVAASGGVIGIGFWDRAVCGEDASDIARAIRYAADVVGVDHVGLGSDFDGTVRTPFDARGMAQITDALLAAGFRDDEIAGIMGGNVVRVLRQTLPPA